MIEDAKPLLHICYAPADHEWVHGRMVRELGLQPGQYRTREDDGLGELQLQVISRAVEECRFTVLVASSASRWNQLAQFAADLAQHVGLEQRAPRLVIVARDFQPDTEDAKLRLSLKQRALVSLDCSDDTRTTEALARLRKELELTDPLDERPPCPYPGLARFTAANRHLLFGRDDDRQRLVDRIRAGQSRILVVGPSGSGKSSLIHAAVLPELTPHGYVVQVVPRGDHLADSLRQVVDALEVPGLGAALDTYQAAVSDATDAQIEQARNTLRVLAVPDTRRRVIVIDPLEEIFVEDDAEVRERLFTLLGGLWTLPWCTVVLCMRADFYGALMVERCWRELEHAPYTVSPLDEPGLRAAIVEPALCVGVHVDAALVERLMREIDRDRSSIPLPLLQVALAQVWTRLRWRYLSLADYEQFVDCDQRGLAVVLGTHATAVVQTLTSPGDGVVAQRVLLDLVHLGEGRPDTRRRRSLDDLRRAGDAAGQLERVVDRLIEGRLVTAADGQEVELRAASTTSKNITGQRIRYIDLAHDTLISGWPMLAGWIRERRDDLRTQRRLEARAVTHALLTADELPEFVLWLAKTETPGGQLLEASDALRTLVRRSVVARRLRRITIAAGLLASMVIALVFGAQAQRLRDEKAKTQQSISEAMKTAHLIVFEVDRELQRVAGASPLRERLLNDAHKLVARLRKLSDLPDEDQRIEIMGRGADADLALERGRLDEASSLYREVLAETERRAASDPDNVVKQTDLAVIYSKLGDVSEHAHKLDDARSWYEKSVAVFKILVADVSGNTELQHNLALIYERLGDIALSVGQPDDAKTWFEQAVAVVEPLALADTSNTEMQRDLAFIYGRLGEVAGHDSKFEDARPWYEKTLKVVKALAEDDPNNARWQSDLAVAYGRLGWVPAGVGKLDDARTWFDKAVAVLKALTTADPRNTRWQHDLAGDYEMLCYIAMSTGKRADAYTWANNVIEIRKRLAAIDPSNTAWQRELSKAYDQCVGIDIGK